MSSSIPKLKLACRKRLRSCDSSKRNIQSDDKEEKGKKIQNDDGAVKNMKTSPVFLEKEKKREKEKGEKIPRFLEKEKEREKEKGEKRPKNSKNKTRTDDIKQGGKKIYNEVKNDKASPTSFKKEKRKEELKVSCSRNNMQIDEDVKEEEVEIWNDRSKLKRRKVSTMSYERREGRKRSSNGNCERDEKNVENGHSKVKSKKKKMPSHDSVEKKINGADRNTSLTFSKNNMQTDREKRTEPITSVVNRKQMRPCENIEIKMQHGDKQKKTTIPSVMSKMKKTKAPVDCDYEKRKREESNTSFKKVKRMQSDSDKKNHSGKVKKNNCGNGAEKKRNTPFSFFKVICNDFKEYLYIPPKLAPELEDLTNHHVYLEDSEGEISKIRLSVVDGFLAFHQGWSIFVSDHLIKWGDFLLFEYTAKSTFFVRIFGRDSCERLHFDVRKQREGLRKKGIHTNRSRDDLISFDVKSEDSKDGYYFSEEYPRDKEPGTHYVTVHTAENPKRVERMVESGSVPLDNRNGNEVMQQCRIKGMSPPRSKGKGVILVTDLGSSIHENDIVKLIASTADSDTHHVAADTKEDPKRVQSDVGNGQSAVVGVAEGRLTDVECIIKCTSLNCSEKKAASSVQIGIENGPSAVAEDEKGSLPNVEGVTKCVSPKCSEKKAVSVGEALLAHENDNKLADDLNLHDSDEDLRRKQISSSNLHYATAVNKYNSDGVMKFSPNVCRNYEAPGGFRCLEKWKNNIVRDWAVLDGTGLIEPESTRETDRVSMCEHDTTGNHSTDGKGRNPVQSEGTCAFIKNPSNPDRISKCGDSKTEINDDIDEKGTIAKLETKMERLVPLGSIVGTQTTNIPVYLNNGAACESEHCFTKQEDTSSVDSLTPTKPKILESDVHSVLKVNLQFCIPNTTKEWLELPKSLSNAVRLRKQDRNIIMLKDPMKRLWPVFYHDNSIFVGFTAGWKPFSAANNLQIGDLCELFKEPGDEEPVYSVQITKK